MNKIPLTQGQFAIVDDEDFVELSRYKWHASKSGYSGGFTAKRYIAKYKAIFMHRAIMCPPDNMIIDHINHNTLDNRRVNLRICTHSQNHQNRQQTRGKSLYKGVQWVSRQKRFQASIRKNNKRTHLGYFADETEAAKAYNKAAKIAFGEFARLNYV